MSGKFVLSYQAKEDLASIWQFTYHRWSEIQADRYIETLFSYFRLLESQPQIGKKVNYGTLHLQQFLAEAHLVFYRRGSLHIEIVRVLHKNTNFIKLLEVAS